MRASPRSLLLWPASLLTACDGPQSAHDPAGPIASSIHQLGIAMYLGAALVTLLVTVLMLVPFLRRREGGVNARLFLWGGGVALPGLTVTVLIPFVLGAGEEMRASTAPDRLSIDITGYVYWWEMSYRRADGLAPAASRTNCACRSASRSSCSSARPTSSTPSGCRASPARRT